MHDSALKKKAKHCIAGKVRSLVIFRVNGTSLIEVVIAIGIISFAMIPLLGLMPAGMNMHRSASDDIALVLIKKDLTAQFRNLGFSSAASINSTNFFYSGNGESVLSSDPFAIYEAKLTRNDLAEFSSKANRLVFEIKKNRQSNAIIAITLPDDGT
jgi:uncharacterized protein (TIGR02598 family)